MTERFPGGMPDAVAYIDKIGDVAAQLWQRVNGYETDGSLTELELLEQVEESCALPAIDPEWHDYLCKFIGEASLRELRRRFYEEWENKKS